MQYQEVNKIFIRFGMVFVIEIVLIILSSLFASAGIGKPEKNIPIPAEMISPRL